METALQEDLQSQGQLYRPQKPLSRCTWDAMAAGARKIDETFQKRKAATPSFSVFTAILEKKFIPMTPPSFASAAIADPLSTIYKMQVICFVMRGDAPFQEYPTYVFAHSPLSLISPCFTILKGLF
jgi:hypothetical protein